MRQGLRPGEGQGHAGQQPLRVPGVVRGQPVQLTQQRRTDVELLVHQVQQGAARTRPGVVEQCAGQPAHDVRKQLRAVDAEQPHDPQQLHGPCDAPGHPGGELGQQLVTQLLDQRGERAFPGRLLERRARRRLQGHVAAPHRLGHQQCGQRRGDGGGAAAVERRQQPERRRALRGRTVVRGRGQRVGQLPDALLVQRVRPLGRPTGRGGTLVGPERDARAQRRDGERTGGEGLARQLRRLPEELGARLRQIRAAVPAQASSTTPEGRGPEAACTRKRGSRASGASSGSTPTTWCAVRPGCLVYVTKVSRSACSRGRTAVASATHRATSALCRSTSTTGGADGSSLTRRRSLSTAASHGLRDTAKSPGSPG